MNIPRPSASLIVSSLALAVSMSGAGYAAGLIGPSQLAKNAVTTAKIKDKTIKLADLSPKAVAGLRGQDGMDGLDGYDGMDGFDGLDGVDGLDGLDGIDGLDGMDGMDGAPGTARAYALVNRVAPSFVEARTAGFAEVSRPATGIYCLSLSDQSVDPTTLAPMVAVERDSSTGLGVSAFVSLRPAVCPLGADIGVKTYGWAAGGDPALSNNVSFSVLIP